MSTATTKKSRWRREPDDAAFIEEQEEGDDDVTDIIGERSRKKKRPDPPPCPKDARAEVAANWGHSSVGRALEWHSRGRRFDPAWLHQLPLMSLSFS